MTRSLKVISAVVFGLVTVGLVVSGVVMARMGLGSAGSLASVLAYFVSSVTGVVAAAAAVAALRHPGAPASVPGGSTVGNVSGSAQVVIGNQNEVHR